MVRARSGRARHGGNDHHQVNEVWKGGQDDMQHVKAREVAVLPAALEVSNLSHSYGRKEVLSDVSFSVARGRFTVLLGLNGAGKTTLFSMICHLYDTRSETRRAGKECV